MALKKITNKKEVQKDFIGYTGTVIYGGYFKEDYIDDLNGLQAIETFDKMRRSDAQIKMILNAIKNPIKSATFKHNAVSDDPKDIEKAEFLDWVWFDNDFFDWSEILSEFLTYLEFGFCAMEKKYAAYEHKDFGFVHTLASLGYRKQTTVESWDISKKDGFKGIRQIAFGDTVDDQCSGDVYIPSNRLCVLSNEKEGDNYAGISLLRPAYGNWFRKNLYLKLNGIGIEKASIGTPIGYYPRGVQDEQKKEFIGTINNFTAHQSSSIIVPDGYKVEVVKIPYDAEKVMKSILYEDTQISKMILFQFLELGQNGSSGSYALGSDQSDLAMSSIQFIGDYICSKIDKINKTLMNWNFGQTDDLPWCQCSGIQKNGKELSELVEKYVNSSVIRPDDTLEASIREIHNLPAAETTREQDAKKKANQQKEGSENGSQSTKAHEPIAQQVNFADDSEGFYRDLSPYEKPINFKEISSEFDDETAKMTRTMKTDLQMLANNTVRIVDKLLKKNESNKLTVANDFKANVSNYEKHITAQLANVAGVGSNQAKRDMKSKGVQLADTAEFKRNTEFLPAHVKAALKLEARTQAAGIASKVESIVSFGIIEGVESGKSDKEILDKIDDDLKQMQDSPAVEASSRTMVSKGINRGRFGFFFDQDNLKKIQAFQYSAVLDSRTTPICLSLDGKIAKTTDPNLVRFRPPNHYGCRSILVPITINEPKPDISGIKPDANNPALVKEYKTRGREKPDSKQIEKSRNL